MVTTVYHPEKWWVVIAQSEETRRVYLEKATWSTMNLGDYLHVAGEVQIKGGGYNVEVKHNSEDLQ